MKKTKRNLVTIGIILIILFGILAGSIYVQAGDTKCTVIEKLNDTVNLNEKALLGYNNIYCVQQGQYVAGVNDELKEFKAVSKATIKGDEVTFEDNNGNTNTVTGVTLTHQIAALLNNAGMENSSTNIGYGSGGIATSGNYVPSEVQIALWYQWNDWVDKTGATEYGFAKGTGNDNIKDYESNVGKTRDDAWNDRIKNIDEHTQYCAEIYFLTSGTGENGQSLILVNATQNAGIRKIVKIWDDDTNTSHRPDSITFEVWVCNNSAADKGNTKNSTKFSEVTLTGGKNEKEWYGKIAVPTTGNTLIWLNEVLEDETKKYYVSDVGTDNRKDGTWYDWDGDRVYEWHITNTLETTHITVKKEWDDENNIDQLRPEKIKIILKNGNETVGQASVEAKNNWSYTFTDLPKYDKNGNEIKYTIEEEKIADYEVKISELKNNTYTITNTHEPEKVKIKVSKIWDDLDDLDEYRPSKIYVDLYINNVLQTNQTKELNEKNNWSANWENLYKKVNGKDAEYTIKERCENSTETVPNYEEPKYERTENKVDKLTTITYKITNKHTPKYDGYIEINGKVWLDGKAGKANEIDGVYNENSSDTLLEGIKVVLKNKDGNQFDDTSTAVTDSNGNYTIRVNYDNSENVYKLHKDAKTVREELETAYIEFEYDANKYTTVKDVSTLEYNTTDEKLEALSSSDKSKATEDVNTRNTFDKKYFGGGGKNEKTTEWNEKITARTITINNYDKCATKVTRNETIKWCNGDGTYIRTNPNGAWNNPLNGQKDLKTHPDHKSEEHTDEGHSMRTFEIEVEVINNINLGLFEREQPQIAIYEDLSKVEVEMDGQRYTYLYNVKSNKYADAEIKVKFQNKDTYTYRRPVNPADIAYIQEPANNNLLKAYVTYEVKIGNLSSTLQIKVNDIINAYDSEYTIKSIYVGDKEFKATEQKQKDGFNTFYIQELQMMIQPGQESETIKLRYEISNKAILGLLNEDATLNNAVEIMTYTTWYGENTLYAEQQTGGRTSKEYGGRDDSSQPANAGFYINEDGRIAAQNDEFDTDIAPSFVLCKATEEDTPDDSTKNKKLEYKILSGTVWQDGDANTEDNERIGNGKQDEELGNVKGVKVELLNVNNDGSFELAKLYKINTEKGLVENKDAITYTDENGNYSFGDSEYGVVTGRYAIKFTYGNGTTIKGENVSARNFKSTIISTENETLYKLFKGESNSEEWHLDMKQEPNYSIAVDDVNLRIESESDLKYSNFNENMEMLAYSKIFKTQLEFDTDSGEDRYEGTVGADGKSQYGKELSVFDFGIIERPREDIFVETSIDYLKITLANGQVLTEGNPQTEQLSDIKAIGFNQDIANGDSARRSINKQAVIEIDSELIQGATLEIRYEIKVTNNGEIDYDYSKGTEYYYFGTNKEEVPVITNSINKLVYYMDNDLVWTADEAKWENKSAEELFTDGLISENTKNEISNKYAPLITEQFVEIPPKDAGENVKVDYISAKRLLANSDDNKFDNHAEVLEIDKQVARTIKEIDEKGIPQVKIYKMGNYMPSTAKRVINTDINNEVAGYHEQDDDRITLIVTAPTGVTGYIITYVFTALIGLAILVIGIITIKKKVLNKKK